MQPGIVLVAVTTQIGTPPELHLILNPDGAVITPFTQLGQSGGAPEDEEDELDDEV